MFNRRVIGTAIVGLALGVAAVPIASTTYAATSTKGLASLSVQGVGVGAIANGSCNGIACPTAAICSCLSATDSLVGNQGFKGGQFTVLLSVNTTPDDLPVLTGESCAPATGFGTITTSNAKNSLSVDLTGLVCPTLGTSDVFNGTYAVSGGTGKFSTSSGGTGTINGSQIPTSGSLSQVSILGTVQPTAP